MDEGRVRDIHALAKAIGRDHSYVSHIMRLATLAPAVIERVIASQELPPGSTPRGRGRAFRSSGKNNFGSSLGSRDNTIAVGQKRSAALFCPKRDDSVVGGPCKEWQGCRSRTDHGVLLKTAFRRQNRGGEKPENGK